MVQSISQVPQQTVCGLGVGYQIRVQDESGELTVIELGPCGRGNRGAVLPETPWPVVSKLMPSWWSRSPLTRGSRPTPLRGSSSGLNEPDNTTERLCFSQTSQDMLSAI
jgi:hypothetical protein